MKKDKTTTGGLGYSRAADNTLQRKRRMAYKTKKAKTERQKERWQ